MIEKIIKQRKSVRIFNNQEVSIDEIYELLDIARFAPSGKNRQPWKLKIIEKADKEGFLSLIQNKYKNEKLPGSLGISLQAISQSDKLILVFNPYSYSEDSYSKNTMLMDTQSIGAFIQCFLLLLTERGISTLWINDIYHVKEKIERKYADNKHEVIAAIAIGYSHKERKYNIRKELDEIIL
ncbi:nitroreductase family protein [Marispirochaeta aestuarii]|uniref:nitroreductase family protein n=1 Tax=Marispirochaeta aestuarii TaxID=1963862 RepID=UPI002ABE8543|nr:nitroreductase family protein [Marispirochaeta aestuarii]